MSNSENLPPDVSFAADEVEQPSASGEEEAIIQQNSNTDDNNQPTIEEAEPNEPDWSTIQINEPARTEVPIFLAARGQRDAANDRFATGIDVLHESVSSSMENLLDVVSGVLNDRAEKLYEYEVALKNDYGMNDKTRASMNDKLEESARMAQGLFANLLMRVAQPEDGGSVNSSTLNATGSTNDNDNSKNPNANSSNDGMEEEEPDFDAIMQHEPARSEVPLFLSARGRRDAALSRFETAIEQFQTEVEGHAQNLTQVVADVYNSRTMKLDEYETVLKNDYVENDKTRASMQSSLEESANVAQNMFGELMRRVMAAGGGGNDMQQQQQQQFAAGMLTQATTLESP